MRLGQGSCRGAGSPGWTRAFILEQQMFCFQLNNNINNYY